MLPLSSSFSSCSFLMNTLFFCSAFALFFFYISTLCLYPFWKLISLSNSSYNTTFFSLVTNLFFKVFTLRVKFPIFRFKIAMVWNNLVALFAFITSTSTSSIDFGVLIYVVGSPYPFANDPSSYTILLPNSNSNGNPFTIFCLLGGTCSSVGLNSSKASCVTMLLACSLITYWPSCVYYCCCCKCWKCFGLTIISIQSSHTSLLKYRCSSPFGDLMSCSFLTPWLCSFSCFSCGNVICGTSYLCSLSYVSCGVVIYGIFIVCLATCTTIGTVLTIIGIADGSTLPFIIFYALKFVLSCSLFTPKLEAPPSSTLFFLLRTLPQRIAIAFFLFSSVVCISSLVLLTLASGFFGSSFWCTNR